jgi:heavy metal efflux system protein
MLDSIIRFSIKNKVIVALGTLALVVWGAISFTRLPIDAIPDITNNQAQVLTVCPTLATAEVEQFVTYPIENAVRTIPGVVELRSISRFGLSVVTVVFEEDIDKYLIRQLINEKLKMAGEQIPAGFGTPELAPVSTGLGEILHYRIEPKPGYEGRYSPIELRSIQDWIVKRQLAGIPGVVEVNSFGGYLKQYEVAVTPARLKAFGIGIGEVFAALENANENTGGAYIEKNANAYFIRSEGLAKSIEDIKQIVVPRSGSLLGAGGIIRIGDIAEVNIGSALRYGAVSHNGEGEIVLGIVMMLKGENAARVIQRVKERIDQIQTSLPEGIVITTFLDREKLVNRTIRTVRNNLIEGALIVIFVLVLLVGNLRAGLIIASVIPLSMLFALGMMQLTGVSANLMSLGAIDFGLIVDGAVIIVEATLHFLGLKIFKHGDTEAQRSTDISVSLSASVPPCLTLSQREMDDSVRTAASKIMRSSVFGVIIILIVYLPILSLTGVEGKMFKPMAQTVSFALIGALILSLTYVPALSAAFLSKKIKAEVTFADRIIQFFQKLYLPTLNAALQWKKVVLGVTLAVFAASVFLFTRMGGEFIPTLDEGDIMMHGFCKPGTSLTQTLESHRLAQKIIMENFPDEVEQVISKIGSAEIPTDPMAPETADNVILLKPKDQWTKAETKEELVEMIEAKVYDVPGMAFEFTQPIKMRFDEMMTGVRSDIAVKIFGENLDSLARAGHRVENIIRDVPGLSDLKVEQIEGLPQIVVRYDYTKIARYGMAVRDVNEALRTAFAGTAAGAIFEDERRFDLVVRLASGHRADIEDVRQLPIATPTGQLIPLSEVAEVSYQPGPAQISRDDGRRRIVVSANVRGRDVESAIHDVQAVLGKKLKLPSGYYYTFGGQFENLEAAKARLSIAVPVALALIFGLLYFAFNSLKESVLIFTAIPMSAIGGVFALLIRGMPFSISAGVGFIALFGVAVLNGIVLIAYFNQLEKEGVRNVNERITRGALVRLRPVLMTAAVASLGFLPMALSHGAGAEVQRPLATVVIGGLVTSTLLTLVVLPVLYAMFFRRDKKVDEG